MPTGSGKSAIYQIAGRLLKGPTLVISPLIALQKDQVDSINEQAGEAVAVNSTQRIAETREVFEKIEEGESNFIFLAPEQPVNRKPLRHSSTPESRCLWWTRRIVSANGDMISGRITFSSDLSSIGWGVLSSLP